MYIDIFKLAQDYDYCHQNSPNFIFKYMSMPTKKHHDVYLLGLHSNDEKIVLGWFLCVNANVLDFTCNKAKDGEFSIQAFLNFYSPNNLVNIQV